MADEVGQKSLELEALSQSVVEPRETAKPSSGLARGEPVAFLVAAAGELITPWGTRPKTRDKQLRDFWQSETWLATTVGMMTARNAALSWTITGSEQTAAAAHEMVNGANFGGGWEEFVVQTTTDLLTQDSGAFVELIRAGNSAEAPVIGFAHLDAARCFPTGVPEWPVLYEALGGIYRVMPWYSVVQLLEMPDPRTFESTGYFYKLQHSAVSRLLRAAMILKNVAIYKEEKTGGRFTRGIHLIAGFSQDEINDGLVLADDDADAQGLLRFTKMPLISAINPEQKIDHKVIEIAGMPDGFEEEVTIKHYITLLANSFGIDYQDVAPLPGGNLGTSAQSEVLDRKSKGKGVALFQKLIMRLLNEAVLPSNVQFEFDEVDLADEMQQAKVRRERAEERAARIASGELLEIEARQLAVEAGDLPQEMFDENAEHFDPDEEEEEVVPAAAPFAPGQGDETVEGEENPESPDDEAMVGERASTERAGPGEERLEFEESVARRMELGMRRARRLITEGLHEHAANGA